MNYAAVNVQILLLSVKRNLGIKSYYPKIFYAESVRFGKITKRKRQDSNLQPVLGARHFQCRYFPFVSLPSFSTLYPLCSSMSLHNFSNSSTAKSPLAVFASRHVIPKFSIVFFPPFDTGIL